MAIFNIRKVLDVISNKPPTESETTVTATPEDLLRHQAFDNTVQANIISTISNGRILLVNKSACKLLGYSKKELLTKSRSNIFDISERSFRSMLKQRTNEGHSEAIVTAIKKSCL